MDFYDLLFAILTDSKAESYFDVLLAKRLNSGEKTLLSISAVYTQSGEVDSVDSLDSLKKDLVVTAFYSDSTSETITGYTLSGTLVIGTTNTITVSYGGKTDTFDVTVSNKYYLFKDGNECTANTGGYSKKGFIANGSRITYSNNGTCLSFVLSSKASTNTAGTLTTANKIDLTNYSKLVCVIDSLRADTSKANMWAYLSTSVSDDTTTSAFGTPYNRTFMGDGTSTTQLSGYTVEYALGGEGGATGERYLSFCINAWGSLGANSCKLKVYKAYLLP